MGAVMEKSFSAAFSAVRTSGQQHAARQAAWNGNGTVLQVQVAK